MIKKTHKYHPLKINIHIFNIAQYLLFSTFCRKITGILLRVSNTGWSRAAFCGAWGGATNWEYCSRVSGKACKPPSQTAIKAAPPIFSQKFPKTPKISQKISPVPHHKNRIPIGGAKKRRAESSARRCQLNYNYQASVTVIE